MAKKSAANVEAHLDVLKAEAEALVEKYANEVFMSTVRPFLIAYKGRLWVGNGTWIMTLNDMEVDSDKYDRNYDGFADENDTAENADLINIVTIMNLMPPVLRSNNLGSLMRDFDWRKM